MSTLTHSLEQLRKTLDGSQPIDTRGAVMAIDHLIKSLGTGPVIPKGTVIHIGGMPFALNTDTIVEGTEANAAVALQNTPGQTDAESGDRKTR